MTCVTEAIGPMLGHPRPFQVGRLVSQNDDPREPHLGRSLEAKRANSLSGGVIGHWLARRARKVRAIHAAAFASSCGSSVTGSSVSHEMVRPSRIAASFK